MLNFLNFRLFFNLVNLLLDEDSEIRDLLSESFDIQSKNLNSGLNSYLTLKFLFEKVTIENVHLCKTFYSRLELNSDDFQINLWKNSSRFLFEQKDFNIFREEFFIISLCFRTIKRLMGAENDGSFLVELFGEEQCLKIIKDLDLFSEKCVKLFANDKINCLSLNNVEKLYLPMAKLRFLIEIWYEERPKTEIFEKILDLCSKNFNFVLNFSELRK